jgi:hypothetical protein
MAIAGIDPGKDGGLVVFEGPSFAIEVHRYVTPVLGDGRRVYDGQRMREMLCGHRLEMIFLELQQAMRGHGKFDGAVASFSTGNGFGLWEGLLIGLQIPYEIVNPKTWQAVMLKGVVGPDTKTKAALVARRLRPDVDWRADPTSRRSVKLHTGICDAFCIAEYGRRAMAARAGFAEVS